MGKKKHAIIIYHNEWYTVIDMNYITLIESAVLSKVGQTIATRKRNLKQFNTSRTTFL
jgi:hypothetical protein